MKTTIRHSILLATLCVAACNQNNTVVHVEVTADPALSLDSYELRLGSDSVQANPLPAIDLDVPDQLAGQTATLEIWGLTTGQQAAYGTATVKPSLHGKVTVTVALDAIDCGQWCIEGGVECMGSGTATCTEDATGCLSWSSPTACPDDEPGCSNGSCGSGSGSPAPPVACATNGAACDDGNACTQDDTCSNLVCTGQPLCTTAPANADPTCSNGTCGFACHHGYVNTGTSCVVPERVFATSASYTGNLGGPTGADATCQSLATAAGLTGTYKAWLSDSTTAVVTRLAHVDGYAMVDGTVVVASWSALISGTLLHAIDLDEHGSPLASDSVWTDTEIDGTITQSTVGTVLDCNGWTNGTYNIDDADNTIYGFVGEASNTDTNWTAYMQAAQCDSMGRLYCFQQ